MRESSLNDEIVNIQEKIASIWTEVLRKGGAPIDVGTSFLDLGGDSLSAVLCMSRLRNTFGPELDVDLSDFFDERSTVHNFAVSIQNTNSTEI
jgi:acyl carrier protein